MADRSVNYTFNARFDSFKAQVAAGQRSVRSFKDDLTKLDQRGETMRRGLTSLGDTAGRMGLVAAGGLAASAKAAIDWETAWAGVTKTVDGSSAQLQQLEGDLREMARTLPASHQEIAAVAEAAGQLGVETESVAEFTETMIALGETTNLTADEAATSIARFSNIMGTSADEVENIGSTLVDLGNNAATTEAEILALGTRLAAAGSIAGLSESDVLAFATTLTSVGVEAEAGGTALSKVFTSMRDAVIDGGDDLDTFASTAGVTASEFQKQWGDDPASAVNSFIQGLGEMNAAGESTSSVFDALSLTDQRLMRALLSTAEGGDLLTESLNRGSDAYAENGALAEEFEKRLGTTESQITVTWNNIRDAGIEVGEVLLPIIAQVAGVVGDLAQGFGKLPGPVKTAVGALAGLTAIFGGGLWFTSRTVNAVANMRGAMADLGLQADGTKVSLSRAAGAGTAFATVAASIPQLLSDYDSWQRGREAADATAESFEELVDVLGDSNLGKYAGDLGIDMERLAMDLHANGKEGQYASKVLDELADATGGFGNKAKAAAGDWLPFWISETNKAWDAQEDLGNILDNNTDLLGVGSSALDKAAESSDGFAAHMLGILGGTEAATGGIKESTEALKEQKEALKQSRDAARESAESFIDLGDSLDDSEVGLKGWIRELEKNRKALRDFQANAQTAAQRGLDEGLIASLHEAGEAGALRMEQLAGATDKEIGRANKAWRGGRRQVGEYVDALGGVPGEVGTDVDVDDANANRKLSDLEQRLKRYGLTTETAEAALDDLASGRIRGVQGLVDKYGMTKAQAQALVIDHATGRLDSLWAKLNRLNRSVTSSVYVNTYEQRIIQPAKMLGNDRRAADNADGGTILGQRQPYGDKVLTFLAPGEEVISNRHGQADKHRDLLKAINANRLASGGTVGFSDAAVDRISTRPFSVQLDWLRDLEAQAKGFERALGKSESALEKERRQRDDLLQQRDSLRSAVRGRLTSDPFGAMDEGGLSDLFSTLRGDIRSGVEFKRATRTLRRRGLDGAALQSVLESGDPSDFAALTQPQLREYERLFNRRQRVTSAAGGAAGAAVFGKEIAAQTAEVKAQTAALHQAEQRLARIERVIERNGDRIEDGARRGTREGISGRDRRQRQKIGNS